MQFRVVVPAAGRGVRFVEAGFSTIKPDLVIEIGDSQKRMIDWSLSSLPRSEGPIVVACHPTMLGPQEHEYCRVDARHSRGQAHSILQALDATTWRDTPVLVINSDMVLRRADVDATMEAVRRGADVGVLVVRSQSEKYSYVNSFPYPTRFAEKRPISDYAMIGAWAFASSDQLRAALRKCCESQIEPFLSAAMNSMRGVFQCVETSESRVTSLGTPDDVAAAGARIVT